MEVGIKVRGKVSMHIRVKVRAIIKEKMRLLYTSIKTCPDLS